MNDAVSGQESKLATVAESGGPGVRCGAAARLPAWLDGGTLLILVVWLGVAVWRPFALGFYHDDWCILGYASQYAPFSWTRLLLFAQLYANRPTVIPIHFLISSVCGQSAPAWHVAGSLLLLLAALALNRFLRTLGDSWRPGATWAATLSVCLWLVLPWSHGYRLWSIMAPGLVAIALFAWTANELLAAAAGRRSRWWLAGLAYLAAILTYEVFYGAFLLLAVLAVLGALAARRFQWRPLVAATLATAAVQGLAVGYNRLAAQLFHVAPSRSLNPAWGSLTEESVRMLPSRMAECLGAPAFGVLTCTAVVAAAWIVSSLIGVLARRRFAYVLTQAAALACTAAGVVVVFVVLGIGGYRVETVGIFSRTMLGVDVWLAVAATVFLTPLLSRRRGLGTVSVAAVVVLGVCLTRAYVSRAADWVRVWKLEQDMLALAPTSALGEIPAPAVVALLDAPISGGVDGFTASWDLDLAMMMLDRRLEPLQFIVSLPQNPITWDGEAVMQRNFPGWPARQLWVWTGRTGTLRRLDPPAIIPPPESAHP